MSRDRRLPRLLLAGTALFAWCWVVARACVQSIAMDEATTFLEWVHSPWNRVLTPDANNHILNSLLMRIATGAFGISQLTVRAPALLGAAIYIGAIYAICRLLTPDLLLQWPLFVTMVYNPFVMDYLVAARGYGLAAAFLMLTLAIAAYTQRDILEERPHRLLRACIFCSVCAGLSFGASFPFAFVDAAAMLMIFLWTRNSRGSGRRESWRILAACVLPGVAVALIVTGPTLVLWRAGQLYFGAHSLGETFRTVRDASLFQLNPSLIRGRLLTAVSAVKPFLFPLLGAFALCRLSACIFRRPSLQDARARWLAGFGAVLFGTAALALAAHWMAFRLFGLLLPRDRTALYLVPLGMAAAGALAAIAPASRFARYARNGLVALLFTLALYFLLCMRLGYFKDWQWDADVQDVYPVLAYYNHAYCIGDVGSMWYYTAALNFYRVESGRETFHEFTRTPDIPPGKLVYVVHPAIDRDFIRRQNLKIVYRGRGGEIVVAVSPELEKMRPRDSCPAGSPAN